MGCGFSRIHEKEQNIKDHYKLGHILGTGSFGQVRLARKRSTNSVFAIKIMAKNSRGNKTNVDFDSMFKNEVELLQTLTHENIIRYHELYEDENYLYAVMDRCEGGELFTQIVKNRRFTEGDAAYLCKQMLRALHYVHCNGIVHRDVKAENFLFADNNVKSPRLVLIDFGMSVKMTESKQLRQLCGSPHYVAPELIKRSYGFKVDIWAVGVIIYLMLYGRYPFEGNDQKSIVNKILKTEPNYNRNCGIPSPLALSFMKMLLQKDPDLRVSAEEAQRDPWLNCGLSDYEISSQVVEEAYRKASVEHCLEDLNKDSDA